MIGGIVLAAGLSSRAGVLKQLLPLAGKPILQHVVDSIAQAQLEDWVVVLGHSAREIREQVRLPAGGRFVENGDFRSGQRSSLTAGLRALGEGISAAVVLLGDQPGIPPEAVVRVVAAYRSNRLPIVRAVYSGQPGHPVLLDRSTWHLLGDDDPDGGARGLLRRHPEWVDLLHLDLSPPPDIDTLEDHRRTIVDPRWAFPRGMDPLGAGRETEGEPDGTAEPGVASPDSILALNRLAWNQIGERVASPYTERERYVRMFRRFLNALPPGASVLDLGCGPGGSFTRAMVERGLRVTGVDISDTMISAARRELPAATFLRQSMTELEFTDAFDGVFSGYSMLCLDPPGFRTTAERVARALRKGGWMFLALNERCEDAEPEPALVEVMGQRMYSRAYTRQEVENAFSAAGMTVVELERDEVSSEEYGDEASLLVLLRKVVG